MWKTGILGLIVLMLFTACGADKTAEEPLRLPEREKTWVKTEEVEVTRNDAMKPRDEAAIQIPVNKDLQEKLMGSRSPASKIPVTDTASCLALLEPLEQTRKSVQREGGSWGMFERSTLTRPYSKNGMQIDHHLNRLVFSLRHLCLTAQGVPLNPLATKVSEMIQKMGKEKTREHLIEVVGEAPADVDHWIRYTEFALKNLTRKVPYPEIQELIQKTQPLIAFYRDLLDRKITEDNKEAFLSDSITLLVVLKSRLANEPRVLMALKEDTEVPLGSRWEM